MGNQKEQETTKDAPRASELTRWLGTRGLKFRAWDSIQNMMHDWDTVKNWQPAAWQQNCITIMQFTGITDRKGNDVYEGDILNIADKHYNGKGRAQFGTKHLVVWGGGQYPAWTLKPEIEADCNIFSHMVCDVDAPVFQVFGNAFEHPSLLAECT